MRNRTKIVLLALATLALTAGVVAATSWVGGPTRLSIAVGLPDGAEARFAARLAEVLVQTHAPVRLTVEASDSPAQALMRFARHEVDLAIVRTDERRIPTGARALAVLEHEAILVLGARKAQIETLADLQGHTVSVLGRDGRNEAFVRRLLELYKVEPTRIALRTVPPDTRLAALLAQPNGLVVMVEPLSRLDAAGEFADLARAVHGVSVHAIGDARALERRVSGLYAETVEAGLLSGAPRLPEDDIETVALHRLLVVRSTVPNSVVVDLMRALFENGRQISVEKSFATRIEPPDTEKGALVAAHDGAGEYVERDVKTVFDRYSDLIYIGMSAGSVFGSAAFALYGVVFRRRRPQASDRLATLAVLREQARTARSAEECDAIEAGLESLVDEVLRGLADGALTSRGLDAFRLACDEGRRALHLARARLADGEGHSVATFLR